MAEFASILQRLSVQPVELPARGREMSLYRSQFPNPDTKSAIYCGGVLTYTDEDLHTEQNTFCPGIDRCCLHGPHGEFWPRAGFHTATSANLASEKNRVMLMGLKIPPTIWGSLFPNSGSSYQGNLLVKTPHFNQSAHAAVAGGGVMDITNALTGLVVTKPAAKPAAAKRSKTPVRK